MKPRFITVEGGEGVGKSTNLSLIKQLIAEHEIPLVCTREPGGTPMAERIRGMLLEHSDEPMCSWTELLMMFAGRAQHIDRVIAPALASGAWVLSDRFTDASFAYQGFGRGMNLEHIAALESLVQGELRPNLTVLLDAPVAVSERRTQARGERDRIEVEQTAFFERVRDGYLTRARANPHRYLIIDASQDLVTVQSEIVEKFGGWLRTAKVNADNA